MHGSRNQTPSLKKSSCLPRHSRGAKQVQTTYKVEVVKLACPEELEQDCQMESQGSYDITLKRDLTQIADIPLQLSEEESDAIFHLARDAYNTDDVAVATTKIPNATFETIQTSVFWDVRDSSTYPEYRAVEPGTTKTLDWTAFYQYSAGTLSGCTNDTLNNMTVLAAAPYYTRDDDNHTVIAGMWSTGSHDDTQKVRLRLYSKDLPSVHVLQHC